jgi:hypothetical protein
VKVWRVTMPAPVNEQLDALIQEPTKVCRLSLGAREDVHGRVAQELVVVLQRGEKGSALQRGGQR